MPPLAYEAIEAIDFAVGLIKQPLRQHEDGAMVGWGFSSAQDVLGRGTNETVGSRPSLIDSLDDREGEV